MYLISGDRKSIIDTSFVERFCIVAKPDAVLIIASYSAERAVTIGKYANMGEAMSTFARLYSSLCGNGDFVPFSMPDGTLFHGRERKRNARTKRKGLIVRKHICNVKAADYCPNCSAVMGSEALYGKI